MKKPIIAFGIAAAISYSSYAQLNLNKSLDKISKEVNSTIKGTGNTSLTNDEVIKGLKEALEIGSKNSSTVASKIDGFNKNEAIKIPFPPEAIKVKKTMEGLGMKNQVDKFVLTLNRAAEEAAKDAAPVFISAVKGMSVSDGFAILKGADNAATSYLKEKTSNELKEKFNPIIKQALQKVQITNYWNPIISKYNQIPGIEKKNPNLEEYVSARAMEGLFKLIADEELKIRKNPTAQVSDLLKKVFGGK
jgi:hypothetical protein